MGTAESKNDSQLSELNFTEEEKKYISSLFAKLSHGKKHLTKEQLESHIGVILGPKLTENLFGWMLATDHKHKDVVELTGPTFMLCISKLLRGSVTDRSHIILSLAAHGSATVGGRELLKCVEMLLYSFARVVEKTPSFKSWILHRSEESFTRLALSLLEDLFHTGDPKNKGLGLPVVPEESHFTADEIENWLTRSSLFLQIFENVFNKCFRTYKVVQDKRQLSVPRIPVAKNVDWSHVKTILDFPSLVFLNSCLPPDLQHEWRFLFSNQTFGDSFSQMVQHIAGPNKGPSVLVVKDKDGHVFGGFASVSWQVNAKFTGDTQCFLFSLSPHFGAYSATGYNDHYMYLNYNVQTMPNGLGMGGQFEYFGLWIDHSFTAGHSKAGPKCTTYGSPQLSRKPDFEVDIVEVWAVGPEKKVEGEDDSDEDADAKKKKSVLDKDPQALAMLSLIGKGPVSEGLREGDETADNPEHNKVISLF